MKLKELHDVSNTLLKGRITELKCELWFLEHNYVVSIPNVPYQYDLLVDIGNKIIKVQIKTCHLTKDESGIEFNVSSLTHNNEGYTRRVYSENSVDYFMTYYEGNYYLVPFSQCGVGVKKLRFTPPANGQRKGISFASDFLIEKILEEVVE